MCVIIVRDPGVTIPQDKLESACIVNPDGWGIAIADRGKLAYLHGLENDPEKLAKVLEDAKNHHVLFHLRFITAGEKSLQNCHPFKTTTHEADGYDIAFAHNGTIYSYKPEKDEKTSDSFNFNQRFVRPLILRSAALVGGSNCLDDKFVAELLEQKVGSSKFALMDGNGNSLIINYNDGTEHEGWWSSNTYSFERTHRTGGTTYFGTDGKEYNYEKEYEGWWADQEIKGDKNPPFTVTDKPGQDLKLVCGFVPNKKEEKEDAEDLSKFENEADQAKWADICDQAQDFSTVVKSMNKPRLNPKLVNHLLQRKSPTFTEITGITSLSEMTRFDPEDIVEMVSFYPDLSAVLLQDLLYELYLKDSAATKVKAEAAAERRQNAARDAA